MKRPSQSQRGNFPILGSLDAGAISIWLTSQPSNLIPAERPRLLCPPVVTSGRLASSPSRDMGRGGTSTFSWPSLPYHRRTHAAARGGDTRCRSVNRGSGPCWLFSARVGRPRGATCVSAPARGKLGIEHGRSLQYSIYVPIEVLSAQGPLWRSPISSFGTPRAAPGMDDGRCLAADRGPARLPRCTVGPGGREMAWLFPDISETVLSPVAAPSRVLRVGPHSQRPPPTVL